MPPTECIYQVSNWYLKACWKKVRKTRTDGRTDIATAKYVRFWNGRIKSEIDNEITSETKSNKFLGVHIDNKLNWKMHIDYVSGKIARGIGILLKTRKVLRNECMTNLYYAFIYPYLIYCNHIWGNTYTTTLSKVQILQNKAIRITTGSPQGTNNETL